MRKFQKQQILDVFQSIHTLHGQIRDKLAAQGYETAQTVLAECQDAAIQVGEAIERIEGDGTDAVACLEHYCEQIYQVSIQLQEIPTQKAYKLLESGLIKAENAVRHMPERREAVFLPYKVSMWDSLESVWMAANDDPDCDAYVIPIPYYDKNKDGSFGTMHYEGDRYPDYVPVTNYEEYDFENRHPDMIFFHNPYDQFNNVTSVHPFFYSKNLRQFTDCLVYIPYYCTSGGMMEAQGYALAYYYADYIVVQAESFLRYFDPNLPREKFLPLGSPKFDKVVRLCNDPPEVPDAWKDKMYCADGTKRKVYFYNTSINGMLANTEQFLKKMAYVFQCFAEHPDACLLWRPHPLLESTLDSMRASYRPVYDKLKQYFLESGLGIYDDTPEIETTIALCDAYIGDSGTSVTSLFGVAGKPVFILNNRIDSKPEEDDWRGEVVKGVPLYGDRRWMVTQGNKLYYSPDNDFRYRYYCDLSDYAYGDLYDSVLQIGGKNYVCPKNAENILIVEDGKIQKTIELQKYTGCRQTFWGALAYDRYLFLIPDRYPAIVRYDTESGQTEYLTEHLDIYSCDGEQEHKVGGFCLFDGFLYLASPVDGCILVIQAETGTAQVREIPLSHNCGCRVLACDKEDLWLLPYEGYTVSRWNPATDEVREYTVRIDGLECTHFGHGNQCNTFPFYYPAFYDDDVYLPPGWGNKYVRLNKVTGETAEWKPLFVQTEKPCNGYYAAWAKAGFYNKENEFGIADAYYLMSSLDKKLYYIDFAQDSYTEVEVEFDREELQRQEYGFTSISVSLQYGCKEGAFISLSDFLEGTAAGHKFDKTQAADAYRKIAANGDGTSGEKIYGFIKENCKTDQGSCL